jgi:hypothetical protein
LVNAAAQAEGTDSTQLDHDGFVADVSGEDATPVDHGALFINSLRRPLPDPLVRTPPRSRRARREADSLVPRRSIRLAGKAAFRDPNPEKQAKREWKRRPADAPIDASDDRIAELFHDTFHGQVDSPTREAMRELMFPSPCERLSNAAASVC